MKPVIQVVTDVVVLRANMELMILGEHHGGLIVAEECQRLDVGVEELKKEGTLPHARGLG